MEMKGAYLCFRKKERCLCLYLSYPVLMLSHLVQPFDFLESYMYAVHSENFKSSRFNLFVQKSIKDGNKESKHESYQLADGV
jgi:hypothetical protein